MADIRDIRDYCQSLTIVNSPTVKASRSAIGTVLQSSASGGGSTVQFYLVKTVFRDYLECNECVLEDDGSITESGEEDVIVAKPTILQGYLFDGETIDGVLYTMTFGDSGSAPTSRRSWTGQHRTYKRNTASRYTTTDSDTSFAVTFYQNVWPFYEPDKSVIAVSELLTGEAMNLPDESYVSGGSTVSVPAISTAKIDLNIDARSWFDSYREIQVCDSDVPATAGHKTCIRIRGSQTYQADV